MSRDKILGLALGILVLGFTGAFCFRPEQPSEDPIPELNDPAKLDRRIAEGSVMPYLTGVEGVEQSAASPAARESAGQADDRPPLWQKPDFLREKPDSAAQPSGSSSMSQAPPDPIPPIDVDTFGHNTAWQPSSKQPAAGQPMTTSRPATYTKRTHRVERGETLSELAGRYLGSSARYMELYEANSDVLASPHNLRPGMVIRIPDPQAARRPGAATQPVSTGGANQGSGVEMLPGPEQTGARERFQPVRHSPLIPQGRTSQEDSPKPATKRLSQIPPTGFPGIDNLLSIINGALNQKAAEVREKTAAAAPDEKSETR